MARGFGDVRGVVRAPKAANAAKTGPAGEVAKAVKAGAAPNAPQADNATKAPRRLSAGQPWGRSPAILHLDIDAFFASIEQLRNPALRDKPVVVGTGVVASASYEARPYGIRAGTSLRDARRRCPDLAIIAGHAPTYQAFATRIFELAAEYGPDVETFLDDAYIDLSGTEVVHGHLIRAADELRRRIREDTGLTVSLGLATNRMVARMVTRLAKPAGFVWLRPGGEADFVAAQPIDHLPGIGYKRAAILQEMGLGRVGDLRDLSPARLRDLFGELGLLLADRARGRDTRPIHQREIPRSIRRETSFEQPLTSRDTIEGMLHYLTERASGQARKLGVVPRRIKTYLRWADGAADGRAATAGGGALTTESAFEAARSLLAPLLTRRMGIRKLGVEFQGLRPGRAHQGELFPSEAGQERLDAAVDDIRRRFGFQALVRGPSLELLERLPSDDYGFVLRTPCLTR